MDQIMKKSLVFVVITLLLSFFAKPLYAWSPEIHGFVESDFGFKISDDNTKNDSYNFAEQRLQLKTSFYFEGDNILAQKGAYIDFKSDFTVDEYYAGKTGVDIRSLNLSLTPFDWMDLKVGRQVLTWGTGDYLFINDLFPKDYVSFFIGRDDEYLKKPSDAVKMSFFPQFANVDFIVIPYFTENTIAKGDRLSFFDSFQGGIAGINSDRDVLGVPMQMENNEYALRVYKNLGSNEVALYFNHGFDKNPRSYKDEMARQLYHERLDAYGASVRGPFAGGIANGEIGYYNSREDSDGTRRTIENSAFKAMLGFSRDLGGDLNVGAQYLYEQKLDYDNYRANLLASDFVWDEFRSLLTMRVTKLFKNQTLRYSLFVFYSPTDKDGYFRPSVTYDINDKWKATLGGNMPWGEDDQTEFGQMRNNKNIFMRLRYSF